MASLLGQPTNAIMEKDHRVYVAATPLRATKGPAQLLMSAAFSLNFWHLQHFMLIIKPSTTPPQPQDPEDIYVALCALSGKSVPGITRVRKISRLPRNRCWFIDSVTPNAVEAAYDSTVTGKLIFALASMIVAIILMDWLRS